MIWYEERLFEIGFNAFRLDDEKNSMEIENVDLKENRKILVFHKNDHELLQMRMIWSEKVFL